METLSRSTRIEPGPKAAAFAIVVYSVLFIGTIAASGVAYTDMLDSSENLWKSAVAGLALGSAFLIAFLAYARWDHVFRDPVRQPMSRILWVPMALMALGAAIRIPATDWSQVDGGLLAGIVVAGIGVGFAEETLFRGVLLRSLRTGGRTEAHAVLFSSVVFGLFHLTNLAIGGGAGTFMQVILAALSGFTLYLFRRSTGLLVAGMVMHGIWDATSFALADRVSSDALSNAATGLMFLNLVFILAAWVASRHADKRQRWEAPAAVAPAHAVAASH